MRPNLSNYAITSLAYGAGGVGSNLLATDFSFTVAASTGALFPSPSAALSVPSTTDMVSRGPIPWNPAPFLVSIDNELLVCSARSGDTFTVSIRGYRGSTASAHMIGAPIVLAATDEYFDLLTAAAADHHNVDVPPPNRGGWNSSLTRWDYKTLGSGATYWDEEFEAWGGQGAPWTVSPLTSNLGGSAASTIDFGTKYRSHLFFERAFSDTTIYFITRPFRYPNPGTYTSGVERGGFYVTCKLSHAFDLTNIVGGGGGVVEVQFFVGAMSNPAGFDVGDSLRLTIGGAINTTQPITFKGSSFNATTQTIVAEKLDAGTVSNIGTMAYGGQPYLRLGYNGGGIWLPAVSYDGITWYEMGYASKTINLTTSGYMGLRILANGDPLGSYKQQVACDWIRVDPNLTF